MKKFSKSFLAVIIFFLLGIMLSGCIGVNRQFSFMKDDLLGQLSNEYQTEYQFSLGPLALHFSSMIVSLADNENEFTDDMIREISSVQIGVYKNEGTHRKEKYPLKFDEKMKRNGWKTIIKSYEEEGITFIYVNENLKDGIKKLFVVSLNEDELVILELHGNLNQVISYAIAEKDFRLAME